MIFRCASTRCFFFNLYSLPFAGGSFNSHFLPCLQFQDILHFVQLSSSSPSPVIIGYPEAEPYERLDTYWAVSNPDKELHFFSIYTYFDSERFQTPEKSTLTDFSDDRTDLIEKFQESDWFCNGGHSVDSTLTHQRCDYG